MKTVLIFGLLLSPLVAFAQTAIFIHGEQAMKMAAHSVWNGQERRPGTGDAIDVYSFDANWKCYFGSHSDGQTYCSYIPGQNVDGRTADPQSILVEVRDVRAVGELIDQAQWMGEAQVPFDRDLSKNVLVDYDRFATRDWQCFRIHDIDSNRPGILQLMGRPRPPDEFCQYASPQPEDSRSIPVKMVDAAGG